jgi:adenylate cyclase
VGYVARIQELHGKSRHWTLGLTTDVGRDPGCTVVLHDPLVSSSHAEIRHAANGQYRIVDLGSRHGTYVGATRIHEHLLRHGEEIMIGTTCLRFEASESEEKDDKSSFLGSIQDRIPVDDVCAAFLPAKDQKDVERLRTDYERLRAAYLVGQRVAIQGDLDGLLKAIADVAIELLHADRVAILLMNPETGEPEMRLVKAKEGQDEDVHVSQSILREVLSKHVGVISADAGADSRFGGAKSIMASNMRSAMCVPMLHTGEMLGAIHCDTRLATGVFREADLELFTTIASQAAVAVRNAMLLQRLQQETSTRVQFQRFFSPGVVKQIVGGNMRVNQRGELRDVTVFFLDIRGFTRMSENMEPKDVVGLLNAFYSRMVPILFEHDGTLDKYVGDELMALFGTPQELDDAPLAAVACAAAMREELAVFNAEQEAAGAPTLKIGIGIHSGAALCGIIGSPKTRQYTAMGDTVNTAARLCSIAKPDEILISRATYDAVESHVETATLPPTEVKGKREPLEVFDVRRMLAGHDA